MKQEDKKSFAYDYVKIFDSKNLYNNLALAALYLATFEILKSTIITNIIKFFSRLELDITKEMPIGSLEEMKGYLKKYAGKKDKDFLACCDWLRDVEAINNEDKIHLIDIKNQRNTIAHELPSILLDPTKNVNISLLVTAKDLIGKIDRWWIRNVDMPIYQDFNNEPLQDEDIIPGRVLYLDHIFKSFINISQL